MKHSGASILIVDDDEDIRELMKVFLEADGYSVTVAADGLDAWDQISSGLRPALILLDLMMPRMDGEQFIQRLRNVNLAHVPVIVLSGNTANGDSEARRKVSCCLRKPVEVDELLNAVHRLAPAPSARG